MQSPPNRSISFTKYFSICFSIIFVPLRNNIKNRFMKNFKSIHEYFNTLKSDFPKLSDYERLNIAVQMQKNDILISGLGISETNEQPAFIEAVAIELGMSPLGRSIPGSVSYEIGRIADAIEELPENMRSE